MVLVEDNRITLESVDNILWKGRDLLKDESQKFSKYFLTERRKKIECEELRLR